jgi:hypothetical protein
LTALSILIGGLLLAAQPASAQGPYGRNSYEDFPFNQGSLFYRPLKPKPRPRVQAVRPAPAPPRGGYTYTYPATQPYTYAAPRQGYTYAPRTNYYYYYPSTPGSYPR